MKYPQPRQRSETTRRRLIVGARRLPPSDDSASRGSFRGEGGKPRDVMNREAAAGLLQGVMPVLREQGWILTPFNTTVTDSGILVLRVRTGEEELGTELANRIRELEPRLAVRIESSRHSRHFVVRL